MTEDEMVRWHHRLDGHEFEQAPGVGDGQGSLALLSVQPKGVQSWVLIGRTDAEAEAPILWPPDGKN